MKFNRESFFSCFRAYHRVERSKSLNQSQVDGLTFLLDAIEQDPAWKIVDQVAYFLATIAHETAWTFKPIKEYRGKVLSAAQKKYWPSGYYGRGYVQITWERNYENANKKLGANLVNHPDSALDPWIAYQIASRGMREGWFTSKKLDDYINPKITDNKNARRIVNGLDKASHIAGIAQNIEKCLNSSVVGDAQRIEVDDDDIADNGETVSKGADTDTSKGVSAPTDTGPSVEVKHADNVTAASPPLEGGKKDDEPIQATQGGRKSVIATVLGGLGGAATAVKGWVDGNNSLALVGVVCLTVILLALIFRQVLMDWLRLKLIADPSKLNVK